MQHIIEFQDSYKVLQGTDTYNTKNSTEYTENRKIDYYPYIPTIILSV